MAPKMESKIIKKWHKKTSYFQTYFYIEFSQFCLNFALHFSPLFRYSDVVFYIRVSYRFVSWFSTLFHYFLGWAKMLFLRANAGSTVVSASAFDMSRPWKNTVKTDVFNDFQKSDFVHSHGNFVFNLKKRTPKSTKKQQVFLLTWGSFFHGNSLQISLKIDQRKNVCKNALPQKSKKVQKNTKKWLQKMVKITSKNHLKNVSTKKWKKGAGGNPPNSTQRGRDYPLRNDGTSP